MNFEEKLLSTENIFDGKVIKVDKETVELPNGKKAFREIVRHHGAVALIPITDDDKIVMIKQWREPMRKVTLEIPAGKIEPGEESDPLQTAIRELNEEARYEAENIELVTPFYTTPGFSDEEIYLYHASGLKPVSTELPQDDDEFLELVELTLPEAMSAMKEGLVCDSKTIMGLLFWQLMQYLRNKMSDKDNEREFFDQDRVEPLRRSDRRHRQKFANPFRNVRKKDNFQNESQHFDEQKDSLSRSQVLAENHENMVEKKTKSLKKKLDIAIVFLIVAIILVFLFMRFVNF